MNTLPGLQMALYFVALVLMSSGVILLMVQFIKALTGWSGKWVMVVAALVGMVWGFLTLRLPASVMWPDLPAFIGGPLMGLVSGMAAVGGKAISAYAIEYSAEANAAERVKAQQKAGQVFDMELMQRNWLETIQQGLASASAVIGQAQPQVQVQVNPASVVQQAPPSDLPAATPAPSDSPAQVQVDIHPAPSLQGIPVTMPASQPDTLTPVTDASQVQGQVYHTTRTDVPFDNQ